MIPRVPRLKPGGINIPAKLCPDPEPPQPSCPPSSQPLCQGDSAAHMHSNRPQHSDVHDICRRVRRASQHSLVRHSRLTSFDQFDLLPASRPFVGILIKRSQDEFQRLLVAEPHQLAHAIVANVCMGSRWRHQQDSAKAPPQLDLKAHIYLNRMQ